MRVCVYIYLCECVCVCVCVCEGGGKTHVISDSILAKQ